MFVEDSHIARFISAPVPFPQDLFLTPSRFSTCLRCCAFFRFPASFPSLGLVPPLCAGFFSAAVTQRRGRVYPRSAWACFGFKPSCSRSSRRIPAFSGLGLRSVPRGGRFIGRIPAFAGIFCSGYYRSCIVWFMADSARPCFGSDLRSFVIAAGLSPTHAVGTGVCRSIRDAVPDFRRLGRYSSAFSVIGV